MVNEGAMKALLQTKASLLPIGVEQVVGEFDRADVVEIRDRTGRVLGRGQANYDANACRKLRGHHSDRIGEILGWVGYDAVVNRQNMDLVDSTALGDPPEMPNNHTSNGASCRA